MSSHHFVKEQQEPALFFLDPAGISYETIAGLLEWAPTILVSEKALDQVLSWGIKIDVILASADFQEKNTQLLESQYPVKFLTVENGDYLEKGLNYLLASKHEAVNLIGISHLMAEKLERQLLMMNLSLVDGNWKYYPVKSGVFKKWFAESSIHIHGREEMPIQIKNSEGEMILPIKYATTIEVPEGITEIKAPNIFWIGEQIS